jgi:hypothetical protein
MRPRWPGAAAGVLLVAVVAKVAVLGAHASPWAPNQLREVVLSLPCAEQGGVPIVAVWATERDPPDGVPNQLLFVARCVTRAPA